MPISTITRPESACARVCRRMSRMIGDRRPPAAMYERRQHRIADGAIRTLGVRALAAQNEQADRRQRVEDQRREDHVVEQLAVRARQAEQRRPHRLHDQRRTRAPPARSACPRFGRTACRAPLRSTRERPARISPLLQPNVEMRIAIAMIVAPLAPNITLGGRGGDAILRRVLRSRAPAPSRRRRRRAAAARADTRRSRARRAALTSPVPNTSASGRFRCGFCTSAAANVTLFHASLEKSEPTSAAPNASTNAAREVDVRRRSARRRSSPRSPWHSGRP